MGSSAAMGGTAFGLRNSYQINPFNPASYSAIDSMTFLMDFGIFSRHSVYESSDKQNAGNEYNFHYLTFSFPLKKWWGTSFGLLPYASKGYDIVSSEGTGVETVLTTIKGSGTLSKAYLGNSFMIGKNLSIGFNVWYMFGTLADSYYMKFPKDPSSYDYLQVTGLNVRDVGITTGLQYSVKTKKKGVFTFGAVFEPQQNLKSNYTKFEEQALFRGSSTNTAIKDTISNINDKSSGLNLPLSIGAGVSYLFKGKLNLAADIYHQKWSSVTFLGNYPEFLTNSTRYSTGIEYTPDEYSIRSYWSRATYRAGGFYENSYMYINGQQIKSYGLTMGLGLPIIRSLSTFNFSAEVGRLGTTENDLIKESYLKFTFHFMIHDRWFFKRKFD